MSRKRGKRSPSRRAGRTGKPKRPPVGAAVVRTFPNDGEEFSGYKDACAWLDANGYSRGSTQGGAPIGILKGDFVISKWRGFTAEERRGLDGTITWTSGGRTPRTSDALVCIKAMQAPAPPESPMFAGADWDHK